MEGLILFCLFWQSDRTYFGNIVGRVANRIGGAQFGIDGVFYKLIPNDGKNLLHGLCSLIFLFFQHFYVLRSNSLIILILWLLRWGERVWRCDMEGGEL